MKLFKRLFAFVAICLCCSTLSTAVGCNELSDEEKNYGGVISSFEFIDVYVKFDEGDMPYGEVESGYYPQLTEYFNQEEFEEHCYCSRLTVYFTDFEKYGETDLKDLLSNTDFLNILQEEHRIGSILISNNRAGATTYFYEADNIAYLLYYDFYEDYIPSPEIEKPLEYIGFIKLN